MKTLLRALSADGVGGLGRVGGDDGACLGDHLLKHAQLFAHGQGGNVTAPCLFALANLVLKIGHQYLQVQQLLPLIKELMSAELITAMQKLGGVWFAHGREIAAYFRENPTARRELDLDLEQPNIGGVFP